ncbi:MAG: hypothetical protein A2X49_02205 [Lentisphaerae bacterium GWF2_52_8]|nr:MAG: hypothetical protein A2X49_02205 [Lentisphaerae bacterium GWF2_52_8]
MFQPIALKVEGNEFLVARVTAQEFGFCPEYIWNPSPTAQHRTEPWPVPKKLVIGIFGNEDTCAKFSPPPFAVGILGGGRKMLLAVAADPGWHLWNQVEFAADREGVSVRIDLEGHSDPQKLASHLRITLTSGEQDESLLALLSRGLGSLYPDAYRESSQPIPEWWKRPIYCGWGDQVSLSMYLEGVGPEPRALAYNTQGLYERWIRRLEEAGLPFGTVAIDSGWSPAGTLKPNKDNWPNLKEFTRRQHEAGRKVLLWIATWLWDGLPDEWCVFADGVKLCADPTNPEYRKYLREQVHELLSPEGFDADGFKIDQLAYSPSERRPRGGPQFGRTDYYPTPKTPIRLAGSSWGCELLHQLQLDIYSAAKAAKPDCLITSSTVHPYFHDTLDMVRIHDMGAVAKDIFAAMGARADLGKAALPKKLTDSDDWIHTDYDLWLRYTSGSAVIGVPCIFYSDRFMLNWYAEPATSEIPLSDLKKIAAAWSKTS